MKGDVIVEEVQRVRDALVKRHGGLDGWIEHLQAMDRERARKSKRQTSHNRDSNGRQGRAGEAESSGAGEKAW
jgi:hypothetical protein